MKKLVLILAVAAFLGTMGTVPLATPAEAAQPTYTCTLGADTSTNVAPKNVHRLRREGWTCTRN